MKHIQDLFKNHPTENTVHVTTDGNAFFNQHYADSHATTLKDKEVKTITREEADNYKEVKTPKVETPEVETPEVETPESKKEESKKSKAK